MNNIKIHKLYDGSIIFTNTDTGEEKSFPKERLVHFYSTPADQFQYLIDFAISLNETTAKPVNIKKKKIAEEFS